MPSPCFFISLMFISKTPNFVFCFVCIVETRFCHWYPYWTNGNCMSWSWILFNRAEYCLWHFLDRFTQLPLHCQHFWRRRWACSKIKGGEPSQRSPAKALLPRFVVIEWRWPLDFYDKVDFSWMGNRYQVIKTSTNVDVTCESTCSAFNSLVRILF